MDWKLHHTPLLFASFNDRVNNLSPHLDATTARVYDTMDRQLALLQNIAVDELKAQKQRLNIYTVQARFALAAIYDLSATTVGSTTE